MRDSFFHQQVKILITGLEDCGDTNFARYVVMNKPSRVRSVLVMEDLSEWKTKVTGTMLDKDEVIMCLKNIAIMHARFWGDKKKYIAEYLKYDHLYQIQFHFS